MPDSPRYTFTSVPLAPNKICCQNQNCGAVFYMQGYWIEFFDCDSHAYYALGQKLTCPRCRKTQDAPVICKDIPAVEREITIMRMLGVGQPTLIPLASPEWPADNGADIDLSDIDEEK